MMSRELRWICGGMALVGLLSLPLSYSLLEVARWSLIPAFQPARAAAFVFVIAVVLSAAGGVLAARQGRVWEATAWFLVGFAIPASWTVLDILLPDFRDELTTKRWLIAAAASLATAWGVRAHAQGRRAASLLMAAALLPYFLLPTWGKVVNYKFVDTPDIAGLAHWARTRTPKTAMFLFPDGAKDPAGSIFRARSLRGVYVDWKGGGQVNLLKEFAEEWWERWHSLMDPGYTPARIPEYAARGVDYIVLTKANRLAGRPALFENSRFLVYKIR